MKMLTYLLLFCAIYTYRSKLVTGFNVVNIQYGPVDDGINYYLYIVNVEINYNEIFYLTPGFHLYLDKASYPQEEQRQPEKYPLFHNEPKSMFIRYKSIEDIAFSNDMISIKIRLSNSLYEFVIHPKNLSNLQAFYENLKKLIEEWNEELKERNTVGIFSKSLPKKTSREGFNSDIVKTFEKYPEIQQSEQKPLLTKLTKLKDQLVIKPNELMISESVSQHSYIPIAFLSLPEVLLNDIGFYIYTSENINLELDVFEITNGQLFISNTKFHMRMTFSPIAFKDDNFSITF
jgi:hypothetical protein